MRFKFVRGKVQRRHIPYGKRRMASRVIRAKIEQERRLAGMAFEIVRWSCPHYWLEARALMHFKGYNLELAPIYFLVSGSSQRLSSVAIPSGKRQASCYFDCDDGQLSINMLHSDCPQCSEVLARGLYRLGFDDAEICGQLNVTLSAHEKLELRLSMPREFWPQKWLEEERQGASALLA